MWLTFSVLVLVTKLAGMAGAVISMRFINGTFLERLALSAVCISPISTISDQDGGYPINPTTTAGFLPSRLRPAYIVHTAIYSDIVASIGPGGAFGLSSPKPISSAEGASISYVIGNGQSWDDISTPTSAHLWDVHESGGTWIVVGNSGTVLRSTNDGQSWDDISTPMIGTLRGVHESGGTWIAVGEGGKVLRSTSGGQSWSEISTPMIGTLWGVHGSGGTWIAVGDGGKVFRAS